MQNYIYIYVYMISIPFLCKYMATWGDMGSKKQEVAKAEQTTSVGRAARCEVRGGAPDGMVLLNALAQPPLRGPSHLAARPGPGPGPWAHGKLAHPCGHVFSQARYGNHINIYNSTYIYIHIYIYIYI